MHKHTEHKS